MMKQTPLRLAILASIGMTTTTIYAEAETEAKEIMEEVVVVGTHIKGVNVAGALPVSQLNRDDLDAAGTLSSEELIGSIPQAGQVAFNSGTEGTSSNSVRGDVASFNLRGLGADSTLILVNGRRMVLNPSSASVNGVPVQFVNTAMIPASGLDRLEVLRDGAAAIYGTDAVAGVVNYVLDTDYEGFEIRTRYGQGDSNSLSENAVKVRGGMAFNDEQTHVTFYLDQFNRSGLTAQEIDFTRNSDYRDTGRTPQAFIGNSRLRNVSTFTPWGQFNLGNIETNGVFTPQGVPGIARSSDGRFHLQPNTASGGKPFNATLEIDDGTLNSDLRYNINDLRIILPDIKRSQFFSTLNHEFDNGMEFFGEVSYYHSEYETYFGPNVISDVNKMYIPKTAYYNPFGAVGSANRLPGLDVSDVPTDGLDVKIDRLRLYDTGPRYIEVETDSYRLLTGLRGQWQDWDWEAAAFHSQAESEDSQLSVSRSKFYAAVSRTTPDAYNPFTGGNIADPANGDPTSGGDASEFSVNVKRKNTTKLSGADFKMSSSSLFSLPAGDIGAAFGLEVRRETYDDDRDPLLDGTNTFTHPLSGQFFSSDIMGVSATPDTHASRTVYSAYAEFLVPILESLDAQIAFRAEDYSDVDEDIFKPKLALSWRATDWMQFRTAWSKGFRAPNLETLNLTVQERFSNNRNDFLRCEAGQAPGTAQGDVDACSQSINARRLGNSDLKSEDSENLTVGVVLEPIENLVITLDWWEIEQDGVVGLFGRDNHLLLDQVLRFQGSSNPNVIREAASTQDQAEITAYNTANSTNLAAIGNLLHINDTFLNLQPRTIEGADISVAYRTPDFSFGYMKIKLDGAYTTTWDQEASPAVSQLLSQVAANPLITGTFTASTVGSQIQNEGVPRWRANARFTWYKEQWRVGVSARYVGKVFDPAITAATDNTKDFKIPGWMRFNAYVNYNFEEGIFGKPSIRLGINNFTNEDPPLFDSSRGYSSSLHSAKGRFVYLDFRARF